MTHRAGSARARSLPPRNGLRRRAGSASRSAAARASRRCGVAARSAFETALAPRRSREHHRRVQAALAVARACSPRTTTRSRSRGIRSGRRRGDLGAHRTDVLRWRPRAPGRGPRGRRAAAAAQGLHRRRVSAVRGARGRRRRHPADRGGAGSDGRWSHCRTSARSLGLAALVEVHDDAELARAIDAGARVIGVNNRNLRTLAVDVDASRSAAPPHAARRHRGQRERAARRAADLERLQRAGYRAFLIGERFMTDPDPRRPRLVELMLRAVDVGEERQNDADCSSRSAASRGSRTRCTRCDTARPRSASCSGRAARARSCRAAPREIVAALRRT